jgi:hypothetical protein
VAERKQPMMCEHYGWAPGANKPTCARGINIREHVGGPEFRWLARTPCVVSVLSKDPVACDQRNLLTQRELVRRFFKDEP